MMHHDFARAEINARTQRYQAEAARQGLRVNGLRRFRGWLRPRKTERLIGRGLRPSGVG